MIKNTTIRIPLVNSNRDTAEADPNSIVITNDAREIIGKAPPAPRPLWLPENGVGQGAVSPVCWSITIENWLQFIKACITTDTWSHISTAKGENDITMYDINDHFVKPWTRGTGCSVAVLFDEHPSEVELMISHTWAGSVKETLLSIESMVNLYHLPKDTQMFFLYPVHVPTRGRCKRWLNNPRTVKPGIICKGH